MQLIDSHAHLDDRKYNSDRSSVIADIRAAGVTNVINIGADMRSSRASVKLANEYDFIFATVGVHPHYVEKMTDQDLAELKSLAAGLPQRPNEVDVVGKRSDRPQDVAFAADFCGKTSNEGVSRRVVAIGEIGLDYFRNLSPKEEQKLWFRKQLNLAKELNLPVVIHDRDAHQDILEILQSENISNGVMHCYSGSAEMAKTVLDMGLYVSFGGVITFKNARVAVDALRSIPMDRLLIETDCPYLAPEPFRGERNSSALMPIIAKKVAEIKGISVEEICNITAENTRNLFGF